METKEKYHGSLSMLFSNASVFIASFLDFGSTGPGETLDTGLIEQNMRKMRTSVQVPLFLQYIPLSVCLPEGPIPFAILTDTVDRAGT